MTALFLTHAEVRIDPAVPVPDWGLAPEGRVRHDAFAASGEAAGIGAVFSSAERKAREAAAPVAERHGVAVRIREPLGENDRSATGYLPREEFEETADAFFARPEESVRGWERARDAQSRIDATVRAALDEGRPDGDVLFASHGGVGALLRCHLLGKPIGRDEDQPHPGGGCLFRFDPAMTGPPTPWRAI